MKEVAMLAIVLVFVAALAVVGVAAIRLSSDATAVILTLIALGVVALPVAVVLVGGMLARAQQQRDSEYMAYLRDRAAQADYWHSGRALQARRRRAVPPPKVTQRSLPGGGRMTRYELPPVDAEMGEWMYREG
jgi:hypothetical protein